MINEGNAGKPHNCVETPHATVDYTITTPKSHFLKKIITRTATKNTDSEDHSQEKTLRKTISNPDLSKIAQTLQTGGVNNDSKRLESRRAHEQLEFDEMFFYYFENILSQVLDKMKNSKSFKNRDRAQSYYT